MKRRGFTAAFISSPTGINIVPLSSLAFSRRLAGQLESPAAHEARAAAAALVNAVRSNPPLRRDCGAASATPPRAAPAGPVSAAPEAADESQVEEGAAGRAKAQLDDASASPSLQTEARAARLRSQQRSTRDPAVRAAAQVRDAPHSGPSKGSHELPYARFCTYALFLRRWGVRCIRYMAMRPEGASELCINTFTNQPVRDF